ncbi:MAG: oxidoreductase family protein [Betaproteobacteria bacterium]|nr:oxidoreductase family protein [Betaproteobacteria bacterium]
MINAAIVGMGRWGQNLVNSVQGKSTKLRFTHGMVRRPAEVAEYAQKIGLKLCTTYEEVLADKSVDAVVLATPHDLHVAQITAAAATGKAVFCEKPLAMTRADAELAIKAVEAAKVTLGVGHDKRFWPSMQEVKRQVESGVLGKLLHIEGNLSNENSRATYREWRGKPENSPGGSLTATGIHILDAFVHLMGPAKRISASYSSQGGADVQDTMAMLFEFKSGATGLLASVRPTPVFWRVHAFGTTGSVEARGTDDVELRISGDPSGQPARLIHAEPLDALRFELEAFADAVAGVAPYPISHEQMILTAATLEAAARAVDTKTTVTLD